MEAPAAVMAPAPRAAEAAVECEAVLQAGDGLVSDESAGGMSAVADDHGQPSSTEASPSATDDGAQSSIMSRLALNATKAGMEGVDRLTINRIIYENSKGSRFFQREEQRDQVVTQRIERMLEQHQHNMRRPDLHLVQAQVDAFVRRLEAERDLSRTIVHVDMDAFFAAVEIRDNPELRGKPIAVGGLSMISTASYEARKYGVRSAIPGFIGLRLCPQLILVKPNFARYEAASAVVRGVFAQYDPHFNAVSLDEAYLDITQYLAEHPDMSADAVVAEMRAHIYEQTQLTASAGIAPNKLLAKVCSDKNKPNGQFRLAPRVDAVREFMSTLPIRKVGGIGRVTERMLNALGVTTCGQLFEQRLAVTLLFSRIMSEFFIRSAMGLGATETDKGEWVRKSVGRERTFSDAEMLTADYFSLCEDLAARVANDLREEQLMARTVTLKLKTIDFELRTRAVTLPRPTASATDIAEHATKLLQAEMPVRLRLMGVRATQLRSQKAAGIEKFFCAKQQSNAQQEDDVLDDADGDDDGGAQPSEGALRPPQERTPPPPPHTVECPICSRRLSEAAINDHLDDCLSAGTIRELVSDAPVRPHPPSPLPASKKSRVDDGASGGPLDAWLRRP